MRGHLSAEHSLASGKCMHRVKMICLSRTELGIDPQSLAERINTQINIQQFMSWSKLKYKLPDVKEMPDINRQRTFPQTLVAAISETSSEIFGHIQIFPLTVECNC
jgi:hypothetical protein